MAGLESFLSLLTSLILAARSPWRMNGRRAPLGLGALVTLLLLVGVALERVTAYNDDGHLYTVVSIAYSHLPAFKEKSRDAAVLMGLCAQLPDLTKEYDAVSLRVRQIPSIQGSLWGGFSCCWGEGVRHMVAVHHYLHGLTDGNAEKVSAAAASTLRRMVPRGTSAAELEPNRVCAAGFAIHLLGDSFAHRRLTQPDRMYPPGLGHFRDKHKPDFILTNEQRSKGYVEYAHALDKTLESAGGEGRLPWLNSLLTQSRTGATLNNKYNEELLREGFLKRLQEDRKIWVPYVPKVEELAGSEVIVLSRTCQEVINSETYKEVATTTLNCNKVWQIYKEAAVESFTEAGIPPTCPIDDDWSDGASP